MKLKISLLLTILGVSAVVNAQSDNIPSWVTKPESPKGMLTGIANVSKLGAGSELILDDALFMMQLPEKEYKSEARRLALKKIMSSLHLSVSQESLFGRIRGMADFQNINLDSVLISSVIDRVMDNPIIELKDEWNNEDEYWCYYNVSETDFQTYLTEFEDSVRTAAFENWKAGIKFQESGDIYQAAYSFAQALDIITPLFYKEITVSYENDNIDLAKAIFNSYMHVYDGIVIKANVETIPIVPGEGMPFALWVTLSRDDVNLRNVSLSSTFNGVVNLQPRTDEYGLCYYKIESTPAQKPSDDIVFLIDGEGLLDIPETFATKPFRERNEKFPEERVKLEPFDPLVSVYLDVAPADSSIVSSLYEILQKKDDFKFIDSRDKADLVISVSLENKLEKESVTGGKTSINQYSGSASLSIKSLPLDSIVFKYSVDNLQVMVPASRSPEKAAKSVFREIARTLSRELVMPIGSLEYDKRMIMWKKFE